MQYVHLLPWELQHGQFIRPHLQLLNWHLGGLWPLPKCPESLPACELVALGDSTIRVWCPHQIHVLWQSPFSVDLSQAPLQIRLRCCLTLQELKAR